MGHDHLRAKFVVLHRLGIRDEEVDVARAARRGPPTRQSNRLLITVDPDHTPGSQREEEGEPSRAAADVEDHLVLEILFIQEC